MRQDKQKLILLMIFTGIFLIGCLGFIQEAKAGYYTSGTLSSTNLLSDKKVASIDSFMSSSTQPSGVTLEVQFSQDQTDWYDSSGNLDGWDTLSAGTDSIDLSALNWSSPDFYYRTRLSSDDDQDSTPVVIQVSVEYTSNIAPDSPSNPSPSDGVKLSETTSVDLSVDVSDPNEDDMDVCFYDASDDSQIACDTGVSSGGTATVDWSVSGGNSYNWYAVADDGIDSATSSTWGFTVNDSPNAPTNPSPSDGSTTSDDTPQLCVDVSDPDGNAMDVSFYVDGNLSATNTGVDSGSNTCYTTNSLSDGSHDWQVVADDGYDKATSSTWSLTVDTTAPSSSISPDGVSWQNTNQDFEITCSDAIAGCETTSWGIVSDGDSCSTSNSGNATVTDSVTCSDGDTCQKDVCYYSEDEVGNTESIQRSGLFK